MFPLNLQPIEKKVHDPEGRLEVFHIWQTIQGEGPFAGRPAVFIRLAGCNLQCPACDTDYTSHRQLYSPSDLLREASRIKEATTWLLVLTGGEPFRQQLGEFVQEAFAQGYEVQVETNGTLLDESLWGLYADISVVCSPKAPKVHPDLIPVIDAWKYVLHADHVDPEDGLPTDVLGTGLRPARPPAGHPGEIFVQPMDTGDPEENKRHIQAAVNSCMRFGYRLSLQTHKLLGLE